MEKLKLKVAELKAVEVLEREELKQVLSGVKAGSGSGSGSGKGSGSGSGSKDLNPKITACRNKKEGDPCFWFNDYNFLKEGRCRAFAPNYILHCSDLI